nr:hypothetical protein Iba_chr02aCG12680 [Ipomoea batatas]
MRMKKSMEKGLQGDERERPGIGSGDGEIEEENTESRHPVSPSPTPPVQTKPKYGTWMLVTKKANPAPAGNNNRQTRKDSHGTANRGNQFGILADMHEDSAPHTKKNNTDKNKQKSGSKSGSNGKASTPRNNPHIPASSQQPTTATLHVVWWSSELGR